MGRNIGVATGVTNRMPGRAAKISFAAAATMPRSDRRYKPDAGPRCQDFFRRSGYDAANPAHLTATATRHYCNNLARAKAQLRTGRAASASTISGASCAFG
jgi:hypothetical protein